MELVKKVQLKPSKLLNELCYLSKNLFNVANYEIRQFFFKTGNLIRYQKLYHQLKLNPAYRILHSVAGSHPPQQVLRQLDQAWKSFFNALKKWKINPSKFLKKPKLPKYKHKNGKNVVIFTNLQCRIKKGHLYLTNKLMNRDFPKIKTDLDKIKGVRIVPAGDRYNIELIYEKKVEKLKLNVYQCLGIDLGLNNLVTTSNNIGIQPIIIKGGFVKSINQYYNKMIAKYKSLAKKVNTKDVTARLLRLHRIRNNKIGDIFHKTSRKIINYCIANNIGTIIIGYNEGWKQNINIGKRNNQLFVQVPFYKLLKQLDYKAELVGITVISTTEEYTSQTCSNCGIISKNHRKHRGLHVCSKCGAVMNADVNGAHNILQKVVTESNRIGDRGRLNCPVCITV